MSVDPFRTLLFEHMIAEPEPQTWQSMRPTIDGSNLLSTVAFVFVDRMWA
jgi:hypothetical protein